VGARRWSARWRHPALILDGPSNGLDPAGVDLILQLIEERRRDARMCVLSTNDAGLVARISAIRYHLAAGELTR
jgi:ABC-type multidrug transport system ATPase subunit